MSRVYSKLHYCLCRSLLSAACVEELSFARLQLFIDSTGVVGLASALKAHGSLRHFALADCSLEMDCEAGGLGQLMQGMRCLARAARRIFGPSGHVVCSNCSTYECHFHGDANCDIKWTR